MAGRRSGKTFAASQWFNAKMEAAKGRRGAVVGPTQDDAREVCVLGRSGLLAINPTIQFVQPHTLIWPNGSRARLFGAYKPEDVERFRGPEHDYIWGDEVATWRMIDSLWPMLDITLTGRNVDTRPQACLTTTPKPRLKMFELVADPEAVLTEATIRDNPHLSAEEVQRFYDEYGGTDLEAQELEGKLLQDSPEAFVPLSWLYEAAQRERKRDGTVCAGLDIARFGHDRTALVVTVDASVLAMEERQGLSTTQVTAWALEYLKGHDIRALGVDEGGLGAGVVDQLQDLALSGELPFSLVPVQFQQTASDPTQYHNKASEMWWRLREMASPEAAVPLALPGQHPLVNRLIMQVAGARRAWDNVGHGRVWVDKTGAGRYAGRDEGTERSPDLADALALSFEAWAVYWADVAGGDGGRTTIHEDSWLGVKT